MITSDTVLIISASQKWGEVTISQGPIDFYIRLSPNNHPKPSKVDFGRVFQCQPSNFKTSQNSRKHKGISHIFHHSCLIGLHHAPFWATSLNFSVSYQFFSPLFKSAIRLQISQTADPQQPFKHEWSEISKSPHRDHSQNPWLLALKSV